MQTLPEKTAETKARQYENKILALMKRQLTLASAGAPYPDLARIDKDISFWAAALIAALNMERFCMAWNGDD